MYKPTEHGEQSAFFDWLQYPAVRNKYPDAKRFASVPNAGGFRGFINRKTGAIYNPAQQKKVAEGLKKGYPDVQLLAPRKPFHGLILEFKCGKGSPTPEQKDWLGWLATQYYCTAVVWSCDLAITLVTWYMDIEPCGLKTYPAFYGQVLYLKRLSDIPEVMK